MNTAIYTILVILIFSVLAQAETYCGEVNRTGYVNNAAPLAKNMNKWLARKGAKYRENSKGITRGIKAYCKSSPNASVDEVTQFLVNGVNIIAESERM
ncbi:MAG TPA: hypothetical protein VGJ93_07175 [Desulfuromonadaceae bacterium]